MGVRVYRGVDLSSYRDIAKGRVSEWRPVGMSSCSSGNVVAVKGGKKVRSSLLVLVLVLVVLVPESLFR